MIHSRDEETIIAQCTPTGSGALALIRLSGVDALAIATAISKLSSAKKITNVPTHTINYGAVVDDTDVAIDQVLFLVMHAPKTFTGQDTVEITCHNNQFIIQAIIDQTIKRGARLAQPGEFTKRAYLNKKIDLTQAEAINELIHAHTQDALKKSLAQMEGSFAHWINKLQEQLLQALVFCETSFEFSDDENITFDDQIRVLIQDIQKNITLAQGQFNQQQQLKDGIRIALIGSVNAGKSSLFNALVKQDRAIVTEIPGTTRDALEAGVYRDNNYLTFVDTAGLRQTHDRIEQEGIKRSFAQAELADIILLVVDSTAELSTQELAIYQELIEKYCTKIIPVLTKQDLMGTPFDKLRMIGLGDQDEWMGHQDKRMGCQNERADCTNVSELSSTNKFDSIFNYNNSSSDHPEASSSDHPDIPSIHPEPVEGCSAIEISSVTGHNIDTLEQAINQKIEQLTAQCTLPFLINKRQYHLLNEFAQNLAIIQDMVQNTIAYELVAVHVKDALEKLAELTGKTISEQSLDKIFRDFCVGK